MRTRMGRVLILTSVLFVLAAGAAVAADQTVDIGVSPADELSISVDEQVYLSAEVGQMSPWTDFTMFITNTADSAWEVTATSSGFEGWYEECDEFGCMYMATGIDLPASAVEVAGGDWNGWEDADAIVAHSGALDEVTPVLLVTGTAETYGQYQLDDPWASMRVTVPDDAMYVGQYRGVVTYTIGPPTP